MTMKITIYPERGRLLRPMALLLTALLTLPILNSCGGSKSAAPPPPVDDTRGGTVSNTSGATQPQAKQGLSNTQKAVITLAGAAALYYIYNRNKNKQGQGPNGQYYLSKNGRVYYRDAQHRAHFVTPPPGGIQVPASEAQQYSQFQGYNGRTSGRDLTGLGGAPAPAQ